MSSLRTPTFLVQLAMVLFAFAAGAWLFSGTPVSTSIEAPAEAEWTCSMHPQVRQPTPGACPICGMDLIPRTTAARSAPDRIVLTERGRALARLRTTTVVRLGDAAGRVRLLGRIQPDERTRKNVTTWVGGRIDRLHVNTTGERVRRGQVIATLYSPEIYGAHQDLLTAQTQVERLGGSSSGAVTAARAALAAARDRLRLLGVPDAELERLESETTPTRSVSIRSPFAGTVLERVATEGSYVETGATLYRVADLAHLWLELDAYEADLPQLEVGQNVSISVEGLAGQLFDGRIAFIDPTLDPVRRTAGVRVELDNPDGQLRPGMFAEADVTTTNGSTDAPLVIPATAPLFTGQRSVVYVEIEDEAGLAYAPRTVRLGPRLGDVYPVVAGLSDGERVVSRGAFALDADLQIRGGPSMMSADDEEAGFDDAIPLRDEARATLGPVIEAYLELQRSLADDDLPTSNVAARAMVAATGNVQLPQNAAATWEPLRRQINAHAEPIRQAVDLETARGHFEPLSAAVEQVLRAFGNPVDHTLHVAYCPMAQDNRGASWVQQGKAIDNAYFGASMRTCGEIRTAVDPGDYLPGAQDR